MKVLGIIPIALLILTLSAYGQIERRIMVEHFTNTKCGICAIRNPDLTDNFTSHPEVLHISIHPSSPYSTCFLSQENMTVNDARTNFYGVYGSTPKLAINGNIISSSINYGDAFLFSSYAGQTTMSIEITQTNLGTDTIQSEIIIRRVSAGSPSGNALLFAGLVEDTVFGNGGNGETEHYYALRRSLFAVEGLVVALPANVGDSLVISTSEGTELFWDFNRMVTFAFLQEEISKAGIQSALSTDEKDTTVVLSNSMIAFESSLSIIPNPAGSLITVNTKTGKDFTYKVLSSNGAMILQGSSSTKTIDIASLDDGLFFIVVKSENTIHTGKFIKML